jgi:hypothetical protein
MQIREVLALARKHLTDTQATEHEARQFLALAVSAQDADDPDTAEKFALHSLELSVGTSHPDYARAARKTRPNSSPPSKK